MKKTLAAILCVGIAAALLWAYSLRNADSEPIDRGAVVGTATFACGTGRSIASTFYEGIAQQPAPGPGEPPVPTGSVDLVLSDGRSITLPQTLSADGARYANEDESFIFWTRGNGAFITENGVESYAGCIRLATDPGGLPEEYTNASEGFSIRLPSISTASSSAAAFTIEDSYRYGALGPESTIPGVRFTIPGSAADGTNLSRDTYLSVESIDGTTSCSATLFLDPVASSTAVTDMGIEYSYASTTDAAAGNRYETHVYALPGTSPCIAVRYVIHYGAIQNYPEEAVREFDRDALLSTFDAIRRTLVIAQ